MTKKQIEELLTRPEVFAIMEEWADRLGNEYTKLVAIFSTEEGAEAFVDRLEQSTGYDEFSSYNVVTMRLEISLEGKLWGEDEES